MKEEKERKDKEEAAKKQQQPPAKVEKPAEAKPAEGGEKKEEDNEPAPKGNGGRTEKYIWTQTLEVTFCLFRTWKCSSSSTPLSQRRT